jgi:NitT/TauT family transport system substrate-binding protein
MAPFIIGQQKGYFAQEGLDLEFVNFQSGAEMVAPLSTGQLDAAVNVARMPAWSTRSPAA